MALDLQRTALHHQFDLEQKLKSLNLCLSRGDVITADDLSGLNEHVQGLAEYLSSTVRTQLYNERCPPHATDIASRAFAIPEILELILDELETEQLLQSQLVCRRFRDTVKSSVVLQRRVEPLKDVSTRFRPTFCSEYGRVLHWLTHGTVPNWECRNCANGRSHRHCTRRIDFQFGDMRLKLAKRCLGMQLAYPPVTKMEAWAVCCSDSVYPSYQLDGVEPISIIENKDGITLGELAGEATRVLNEHRRCWENFEESGKRPLDGGVLEDSVEYSVKFWGVSGETCERCESGYGCTSDNDDLEGWGDSESSEEED